MVEPIFQKELLEDMNNSQNDVFPSVFKYKQKGDMDIENRTASTEEECLRMELERLETEAKMLYKQVKDVYRESNITTPIEDLVRVMKEISDSGNLTARAQLGVLYVSLRNPEYNSQKGWEYILNSAAKGNSYAHGLGARMMICSNRFSDALEWFERAALMSKDYVCSEMCGIFYYLGIGTKPDKERAIQCFKQADKIVEHGVDNRVEFCEQHKEDIVLGLTGDDTKIYEIGKCWEIRGMFDMALYWFLLGAMKYNSASLTCVRHYIASATGSDDYVFELELFYEELVGKEEVRMSFAKMNPIKSTLFRVAEKLYDKAASVLPIPSREERVKEMLDSAHKKQVRNFLDAQGRY